MYHLQGFKFQNLHLILHLVGRIHIKMGAPLFFLFFHHHEVQNQGYNLCNYVYAQKFLNVAVQSHFQKIDYTTMEN